MTEQTRKEIYASKGSKLELATFTKQDEEENEEEDGEEAEDGVLPDTFPAAVTAATAMSSETDENCGRHIVFSCRCLRMRSSEESSSSLKSSAL